MLKEMYQQLKQKFSSESGGNEEPQQPDKSPASLSTERIKAVVAELNSASTTFSEAGFIMDQLDINIGLSSHIIPHFRQLKEISPEEQEQLLGQLEANSIIKFVLISLFKSSNMKSLLDNTDMFFHHVAIDISTAPSVCTVFKREYSVADQFENTRH
ncbi:MAG: hypothetical protein OQK04_04115 [Kangiellaceae bacterium]|nr:hypothetical protein [Kangiellaceae bacterium]MCW8997879.1 hypothetical protein [Kangiellaceae bacterium]